MKVDFPIVGVAGNENIARGLIAPALALGVKLEIQQGDILNQCDLLTVLGSEFPISKIRTWELQGLTIRPASQVMAARQVGDAGDYFVLVARSPHEQGAVWTPMGKIIFGVSLGLTSVTSLSENQVARAQIIALEKADEIALVGVACVGLILSKSGFEISSLNVGPSQMGDWSVVGARTGQYEQHLRAILDLPLGDTQLIARRVVSGFFRGSPGSNMYRPYLHLMARSPGLKFHHYLPSEHGPNGYVTATGDNLLELREGVSHALEYLNGELDE